MRSILIFTRLLVTLLITCLFVLPSVLAESITVQKINGVYLGMSQEQFTRIYPRKAARTYRSDRTEEWITFAEPLKGSPLHTLTFHFKQGKVLGWALDDRDEVLNEYAGEFCSQGIARGMPRIFTALKEVLRRMPLSDFLNVTDRHRPVLFTEYYDSGTARFANTSEIMTSDDDAVAADKGMTIIKLSSALNEADSPAPVEGVLAHELAHRVLDHARKGRVSCKEEREANRLIKQWGFTEEFKEASRLFGHKEGDPVSCHEDDQK